jgi:glycosyltransferase involved in cell wall biosynthesis
VRLCFLTSTPLNVSQGSGTYTGITTLLTALQRLGIKVEILQPQTRLWPYTLRRWLFNGRLLRQNFQDFDAVIGFDLDGFAIPGLAHGGIVPRFAFIKGVIADERRFERGITKALLGFQARWERRSVEHADGVVTTSSYSKECLKEWYGRNLQVTVIPELIDLDLWSQQLLVSRRHNQPQATKQGITRLLTICHFYRRKNLDVLLRAMALLADSGRRFELRIVGEGPMNSRWRRLAVRLGLASSVNFVGTVGQEQLASEYVQADIFCLPSIQEGFGIVLLEAMSAGLPIVASRAASIPEVVPHASLVPEDDAEAWAAALLSLAGDASRRVKMSDEGLTLVRQYDARPLAEKIVQFIEDRISRR